MKNYHSSIQATINNQSNHLPNHSTILHQRKFVENNIKNKKEQSMFQFLKRKKISNTSSQSNKIQSDKHKFANENIIRDSESIKESINQELDMSPQNQKNSNKSGEQFAQSIFISQEITPAKQNNPQRRSQECSQKNVQFPSSELKEQWMIRKSHKKNKFLSFVLPPDSKLPISVSQIDSNTQKFDRNTKKSMSHKLKQTKKQKQDNIQNLIDKLCQKVFTYYQDNNNYQSKSVNIIKQLFETIQYFEQNFQDKHNKQFNRIKNKLQELKESYHNIQKFYSQLDHSSQFLNKWTQDIINKFRLIQSNQVKWELQNSQYEIIKQKNQDYKQKIQKLQKQLESVQSSLNEKQINQKQLEKQLSYEKQTNKSYKNQIQQNNKSKMEQYQVQLEQYKNLEKQFFQKIQQHKVHTKKLEQKIIEYQKQINLKNISIEKQTINIVANKLTSELDIAEFKKGYRIKQQEYIHKISILESLLRQQQNNIHKHSQKQNEISDLISIYKTHFQNAIAQNYQLLRKIDQLNHTLYQYWTGLKDVKILTSRLGFFNKLVRIYEDITFSDVALI